jgi:spore maturation protein CgeB
MYGDRAKWIAALRASGIEVSCFGHGTENGVVSAGEIPEIFRTSRISLNFSGAGQGTAGPGDRRQIKARTFEVPGAGGFLLTEAAPGLDRYFSISREIVTFETLSQLVEKVRYYLDRPDERDAIARAGHARTMAEHIYERRISEILDKLRPLEAKRTQAWSLSAEALAPFVEQYRRKGFAEWLRALLVAIFSLFFGKTRGPRAARRFTYELSWRLCGARTYTANGLPGRLFYTES